MTSPWVDDSNAAIFTDLYELTMLQSYFDAGMNETAVFDFFMRRLPANRNYFIACGLEHVLHYLETFEFTADAIDYLRSLNRFSSAFLDSLRNLRFEGDIYAVPEGAGVFVNEPLIEVVAPLPQAQIVETFLMNQMQLATMAASKAARVVHVAKGRSVVDFGTRRMHGADAGLKQPRAFYIGGVDSTSNVLAGRIWGIPVAGTMAHSYILSFENETDAFRHFLGNYPTAILLIDTYEVHRAVENVIGLSREMGSDFRVSGVRLDSGDLTKQAHDVRRQLDDAGLSQVKIFASSSLDEYEIDRIVRGNVPINGFGVGRHLATSSDVPVLDTAYKLVEYAGSGKMKLSESKSTLPGRKQVFREWSGKQIVRDVIALADEKGIEGEPILQKVMEKGRRTMPAEPLQESRARCRAAVDSLPEKITALSKAVKPFPIQLSPELARLEASIRSAKG